MSWRLTMALHFRVAKVPVPSRDPYAECPAERLGYGFLLRTDTDFDGEVARLDVFVRCYLVHVFLLVMRIAWAALRLAGSAMALGTEPVRKFLGARKAAGQCGCESVRTGKCGGARAQARRGAIRSGRALGA
jgi:hypothetical protein